MCLVDVMIQSSCCKLAFLSVDFFFPPCFFIFVSHLAFLLCKHPIIPMTSQRCTPAFQLRMDPSFSPDARTQASEAELTHCCDITYHPWPVNLRQLSGWELGGPEWSGVSGSGRVTQLKHKWNRHFTACGCFSSHETRPQMPKFCPHICIR